MITPRSISLVAPLLACLVACGGGDPSSGTSSAGGGGSGGEAARLPLPFMPEKPANPYVDTPYLQEINHSSNEVEPGLEALVAVLLPPPGLPGLDLPTQVTPRGLARHVDGALVLSTIDPAEPDLVGAAASHDLLVLAGPHALHLVGPEGSLGTELAPEGVTLRAVIAGASAIYLLTDQGLGRLAPGAPTEWPTIASPLALAVAETPSQLFVGGADFLSAYPLPGSNQLGAPLWTLGPSDGLGTFPIAALVPEVTLPAALDLVVIGQGDKGLAGLTLDGAGAPSLAAVPEFANNRVPLWNARAATKTSDGGFVVATDGGAYRIMDRGAGNEYRVYNHERWLPSEDVRAVETDASLPDGPLWFATAKGLATVTAKRMTLEEKLSSFVDRVVSRHDRDGAVADSRLGKKGDLTTSVPYDSDNDGSWTSYWILGECFRYAATGAPDAKAHVDKSLEAMFRLRDQTGTDWFVSRAAIRKEGCVLDDCENPDDGLWFSSPDGAWWMKGDTSNDEVIAHVFMMGHAYDLCADEPQKVKIRAHIAGIIGGIVDHGYQLFDHEGKAVTTYGQFDPEYVNVNFAGKYGDGGVRAAEILAGLDLAHYLTKEARFLDAKKELIEQHHYDDAAEAMWDHEFHQGDGDGDEMGTEAWFVLLRYEDDPALRARWLTGYQKTWDNALVRQQGAWWTLVNGVVGNEGADLGSAARWLQLAPVDMIRWDQHNSHRHDLVPVEEPYKKGSLRSDGQIIPYDERPCDRWNTHQFKVDGGMGAMIEMDGADVLAPYWMARYYGLIVPLQ
jgi:hypothetical protein